MPSQAKTFKRKYSLDAEETKPAGPIVKKANAARKTAGPSGRAGPTAEHSSHALDQQPRQVLATEKDLDIETKLFSEEELESFIDSILKDTDSSDLDPSIEVVDDLTAEAFGDRSDKHTSSNASKMADLKLPELPELPSQPESKKSVPSELAGTESVPPLEIDDFIDYESCEAPSDTDHSVSTPPDDSFLDLPKDEYPFVQRRIGSTRYPLALICEPKPW